MRYEESMYQSQQVGEASTTRTFTVAIEGELSEIPLNFIAEVIAKARAEAFNIGCDANENE